MKGIEVPEREEDFAADPVELFFDLTYVFAFSQLVGRLIEEPTWPGAGRAGLLFLLLWLPWSQFCWSANAVSGNGRTVRLLFLVATAASVPMAASVSTAFGSGGPLFAVTLSVIVLIALGTMFLGVEHGSEHHRSAIRWALPNGVVLLLVIGGGVVDGNSRIAMWIAAVLTTIAAMVTAGRGEWLIRTGHFAERHGLIVIIALGEVVVAIGIPVVRTLTAGEGLSATSVIALVASGVFAALLWWGYFDRPGPALEHRAESIVGDRDRGRFVRDVYTWAHLPLVAGIVVAAAGLEQITLHPADPVPAAFRVMLFGGFALVITGIGAAVWRAFRAVARERIVSVAVVGALLVATAGWPGHVVLISIDLVIAATLVVEHLRIET